MIKDNNAVEVDETLDAHGGWPGVLSDLVAGVDLTPFVVMRSGGIVSFLEVYGPRSPTATDLP